MVGSAGAAMFAKFSLKAGFVAVGMLMFGLVALVALAVRDSVVEK